MIELKNITKKYGARTVLSNISLRIHPGECVCIVGPSGSGKSVLLDLLLCRQQPTSGLVETDGIDLHRLPPSLLTRYRRHIGTVFQGDSLSLDQTVAENIALPLELRDVSDSSIEKNVTELLRRTNLLKRASDLPHSLSRGERALVHLARALAASPLVLLADEPLGALDTRQAGIAVRLLKEAHAKGTTVVLFTRDGSIAASLNARIVTLKKGTVIRDEKGSDCKVNPPQEHRIIEGEHVKITAVSS